jgi:hypothetical protein
VESIWVLFVGSLVAFLPALGADADVLPYDNRVFVTSIYGGAMVQL